MSLVFLALSVILGLIIVFAAANSSFDSIVEFVAFVVLIALEVFFVLNIF